MKYFMDTTETVTSGVGFSHYGLLHVTWLFAFVIITVLSCIWYCRAGVTERNRWKKVIAILLIADELFKVVMLLLGNRYRWSYLPLHLCSINIFLIALHAWYPNKVLGGFLYTVAIPGALAALLFPTWTSLPFLNFMHLHSFTVHILLALYPIVLAVSGELSPQAKEIPKYLGLLVAMAVPILFVNILLDTNFMFLMSADPGNPLYLFEELWGNHLYGFPVIIAGVLIVMYVPLYVIRFCNHRNLKRGTKNGNKPRN